MAFPEIPSFGQKISLCREDALCGILGLGSLETRAFWVLKEKGSPMVAMDVADALERDRTSVQRALKALVALGLAARKRIPSKRGRKFAYEAVDSDRLKEVLNIRLDAFYAAMREQIESM